MSDTTPHPDAEPRFAELHDLLVRMMDGDLADGEHARMESLLVDDLDAQGYYVDFMSTHALLRSELAPEEQPIALERREGEQPDAAARGPYRFASIRVRRSVAIAASVGIAAAIALAFMQGVMPLPSDSDEGTVAAVGAPVATLVDGTGAAWAETSTIGEMTPAGGTIPRGVIALRTGDAQVMFDSGTLVTVKGPAELHMLDGNRCELRRGALLASVPKRARGFTVETPGGQVVDLGTEFGVVVDDRGVVEVHVLKGHVEAGIDLANGGRKPRSLTGGKAIRYGRGAGKAADVPVDGPAFGRPARETAAFDAGVRFVGSQLRLAAFRTTGVVKTRDPDGDSVYGTDGYVLFGTDAANNDNPQRWASGEPLLDHARVELPTYATAVRGENGAVHARSGNYLIVDDPDAPGDASVGKIESGVVAVDRFAKVGQELALFSITLGDTPAEGFRIGVLANNQPRRPDRIEHLNNLPATIRLGVTRDGRAVDALDSGRVRLDRAGDGLGLGDWYFFDVVGAKPGDVLTVHATNHPDSAHRVRNKNIPFAAQVLGGVTFDPLPRP